MTNKYYFRVHAECEVDCYLKAENKQDAISKMGKVIRGNDSGVSYNFDAIDLGSLINVIRMERILKRDPKTGKRPRNKKLVLSQKDWKILGY